MSVVTTRTRVTTRHEYLVPQPAAYGDVQEAISFAKRDAQAAGQDTSYTDASGTVARNGISTSSPQARATMEMKF